MQPGNGGVYFYNPGARTVPSVPNRSSLSMKQTA